MSKSGMPPVDEQMFRLLVESVRDYAIFLLTPEGVIATWNRGAEQLKGYKADEIIGQHFSRFYSKEMLDKRWPETELRLAREQGRVEDEGWRIRKDGSRFWANVIITALYAPDGELRGFAKITRDLTERLRYEESLRSSEERLHLLIDSVTDYAIFMLDPEGRVSTWNTGARRLKGYDANEIIGQHFSKFYLPEAIDQLWPEHELRVAAERGRFEDEGWRLKKDGSRFWANVVITAVFDADKKLRGFAKVTRDLTERRRVSAMQISEKHMEEFLGMLGHELRNPLGAISNAAALIKRADPQGQLQKASAVLDRQIKQLSRLVDDLLDATRIRQGKIALRMSRVDLKPIIEAAIDSVPLLKEKQHAMAVEFQQSEFQVLGDPERLIQAFINVLNNAAKYTEPGGKISIGVEARQGEAVIRIKDSGVGIEPDLLPNIFDLFRQGERTLHDAQGGLGIGLTLVQRILIMHRGSIEAFSHGLGTGSEFVIRIPLIDHDEELQRSNAVSD